MPLCPCRCLLMLCLLACVHLLNAAPKPAKPVVQRYQMDIVSKAKITVEKTTQAIAADTRFCYTLKRQDQEVSICFDSIKLQVQQDGKAHVDTFLSKDRLIDKVKGVDVNLAAPWYSQEAHASDEQKKQMSIFGIVLYRYQTDAEGKELARFVTVGKDSKALVDNGLIANARLFHVPFSPTKQRWTAPADINAGSGCLVHGELSYEKSKGAKDMPVRVKVAGMLSRKEFNLPGGITMKNIRYQVRGEQTYDPKAREWVAGKLEVVSEFDLSRQDQKLGSGAGTMTITLSQARCQCCD